MVKLNKLNKTLSRADSIQTDENGLALGTLKSIELVDTLDGNSKQLEFQFETLLDSSKTTILRVWTGLNINYRKFRQDDETYCYNKLTTLLLAVGLIKESELESIDPETVDIDSLVDKVFSFELLNNHRNLQTINLKTLNLLDKD